MDLQSLVAILSGANSPNQDVRKAAEESLNQVLIGSFFRICIFF